MAVSYHGILKSFYLEEFPVCLFSSFRMLTFEELRQVILYYTPQFGCI